MMQTPMVESHAGHTLRWEKLPEDFELPDEPVENIDHPILAGSLREALELAGFITPSMLIATNFGLCAVVDDKMVVKAPDWVFVPSVLPLPAGEVRRSYTPHVEGDVPALVMEFLSRTDGDEYSARPAYPYGKWHFYEQILQVPIYVIFDPTLGLLEVYKREAGKYELQQPAENGRYWLEAMKLFLGTWQGTKANRTGPWLRWWDESGNLLPWGSERVEQERQEKELAQKRATAAEQKVTQLMKQLQVLGIKPDDVQE